jgi:hypothetical protein
MSHFWHEISRNWQAIFTLIVSVAVGLISWLLWRTAKRQWWQDVATEIGKIAVIWEWKSEKEVRRFLHEADVAALSYSSGGTTWQRPLGMTQECGMWLPERS